ncbi:MAG TPA: YidC/Oxa1 family membrane protein insertase [Chloroflexia bacterium]|nr:YidC/Oxa1 family membrane protein insertase [Chloroflexia bacterium]
MEFLGLIWESFWHLLLNILVAINSVVNFPAVSIIIFTLFMRLLTVPLTMKALRSSRNMQAIQPKIREIQKQYGKDRAKQQEETMKLYQEYGINPAAGCFPMLVQLPIFIGLYSALDFTLKAFTGDAANIAAQESVLRSILFNDAWVPFANFSAGFLWVPNLAAADPLFIWPVLSGLFQFIQSRMAMPHRDPNQPMDPQQKMMNGMMQFMPIYIVFISAGFPAGTVIYWAFSSLFGAVQQYFITGFGSLPDLPGMGFLPRKPLVPPTPPARPPDGAAKNRGGVMTWMMSKAQEAQEAQKKTTEDGGSSSAPATAETRSETPRETKRETRRETKREPVPEAKPETVIAPTANNRYSYSSSSKKAGASTPKVHHYASDGNGASSPNGSSNGFASKKVEGEVPAQLPRKKRNKR